jgi:hypothetical protein
MRYSAGGVRDYVPNGCTGPDLPATIPEVRAFQAWYGLAGHTAVSTWENGDVWGSGFRDDGGDVDPSGGSDLPEIYLFAGHGSCQNPPVATSPDFLIVCGNFGTPNTVNIGNSSRWGNGGGRRTRHPRVVIVRDRHSRRRRGLVPRQNSPEPGPVAAGAGHRLIRHGLTMAPPTLLRVLGSALTASS